MHPSIIPGALTLFAYATFFAARSSVQTLKAQAKANPTPALTQKLRRHTVIRDLVAGIASLLFFAALMPILQTQTTVAPVQLIP